jgi:hypothetical protein
MNCCSHATHNFTFILFINWGNCELLWDNLKDNHSIFCLLNYHIKLRGTTRNHLRDNTNVLALTKGHFLHQFPNSLIPNQQAFDYMHLAVHKEISVWPSFIYLYIWLGAPGWNCDSTLLPTSKRVVLFLLSRVPILTFCRNCPLRGECPTSVPTVMTRVTVHNRLSFWSPSSCQLEFPNNLKQVTISFKTNSRVTRSCF